jgi:O-acetylserine/cysteine efflux transporter
VNHPAFGWRDYLAALGAVLIWGTNFIAMKFALHDMTPFQLGAARYLFAVLPLILFVPRPKLAWKWVVLYGLFQGVCQFGCLFLALKVGMSAALGSVLMQTQVFFTALFGFVLMREHASRALLAGLSVAALGIACFAMNYLSPGADLGGTTALGFVLVLGAAAMWAASNLVVRRAQQSTPEFEVVPFMVWCSLVPIVPFILLSLAFDPPEAQWRWSMLEVPWSTWLSLAYLGWFATILAYALWTGLLKRHPMNRVAPFSLAVPVVGISSGMLVFGDVISAWQWAGTALIVVSLVIVMFGARWMGPKLR